MPINKNFWNVGIKDKEIIDFFNFEENAEIGIFRLENSIESYSVDMINGTFGQMPTIKILVQKTIKNPEKKDEKIWEYNVLVVNSKRLIRCLNEANKEANKKFPFDFIIQRKPSEVAVNTTYEYKGKLSTK